MRKWTIVGALALITAAWWAQGEHAFLQRGGVAISGQTFGDLKGYNQVIVLNTHPRLILAKRAGETMLCPMPTSADGTWEPCWEVRD